MRLVCGGGMLHAAHGTHTRLARLSCARTQLAHVPRARPVHRPHPKPPYSQGSPEQTFEELLGACEVALKKSVHNGATAVAALRVLERLESAPSEARAALTPGAHQRLARVVWQLLDEIKASVPKGMKHTRLQKLTDAKNENKVAGGLALWARAKLWNGVINNGLKAKRAYWPRDAPEQTGSKAASWYQGEVAVSTRIPLLVDHLRTNAAQHVARAAAAAAAAPAAPAPTSATAASTSAAPAAAASTSVAPLVLMPAQPARQPWLVMPVSFGALPQSQLDAIQRVLRDGHVESRDAFAAAMAAELDGDLPAVYHSWQVVYDVLLEAQLGEAIAQNFNLLLPGNSRLVHGTEHALGLAQKTLQTKLNSLRQRKHTEMTKQKLQQGPAHAAEGMEPPPAPGDAMDEEEALPPALDEADEAEGAAEGGAEPPAKRACSKPAKRTCTLYEARSATSPSRAPSNRSLLRRATLAPASRPLPSSLRSDPSPKPRAGGEHDGRRAATDG